MNNYRLLIQYEGTRYSGWQTQSNSETIQQKIADAIEIIIKEKVVLNGSGRTDSGVHALGQTANFRTNAGLDLYRFKYQVNSLLPDDISIITADEVAPDFHSRYDARKRSYIYLFSGNKSPFLRNFSWNLYNIPDIEKLQTLSSFFIGRKDFGSYCKTSSETLNKTCQVYEITWRYIKDILVFYITADRFLHGMVRSILGTILEAAKQNKSGEYIDSVFEKKDRSSAGESVPAKGLFLYKVKYDY